MQGFGGIDILWMVGILAVMYLFILRPKIKEQKETDKMLSSIKKGDRVLTHGGMYGEVFSLKDNTVTLKVGDNVKIDFLKTAISKVVPRDQAQN